MNILFMRPHKCMSAASRLPGVDGGVMSRLLFDVWEQMAEHRASVAFALRGHKERLMAQKIFRLHKHFYLVFMPLAHREHKHS